MLSVRCPLCLALRLLVTRMRLYGAYRDLCLKSACVALCRNLPGLKRRKRKRQKSNLTRFTKSSCILAATPSQRGGECPHGVLPTGLGQGSLITALLCQQQVEGILELRGSVHGHQDTPRGQASHHNMRQTKDEMA